MFIQKESSCGFLKLLFTKDQRITRIEGYYQRIDTSIESFEASCDILETASLIDMAPNYSYRHS